MPFAYGLLIGAAAVVLYIVVGYPMLLTSGRWRMAPPVRKDPGFQPSVTIIMAVYNGAAHIRAKLDVFAAFDYPKDRIQIIVVSDGSTDETDSLVRQFEGAP